MSIKTTGNSGAEWDRSTQDMHWSLHTVTIFASFCIRTKTSTNSKIIAKSQDFSGRYAPK
jgi:hypothetical protein